MHTGGVRGLKWSWSLPNKSQIALTHNTRNTIMGIGIYNQITAVSAPWNDVIVIPLDPPSWPTLYILLNNLSDVTGNAACLIDTCHEPVSGQCPLTGHGLWIIDHTWSMTRVVIWTDRSLTTLFARQCYSAKPKGNICLLVKWGGGGATFYY